MLTTTPSPFLFNGGKMQHIFEFDVETRAYKDSYTSEAARVALQDGADTNFFYKIDGSNGMIRVERRLSDENCKAATSTDTTEVVLHAYQRLDTRTKPPPAHCIPLPETCRNVGTYTGHSYCYEPVHLEVHGKKLQKRNKLMLEVVNRHRDALLAFRQEYIPIEWVGAKFNKTPGVDCDVAVCIHAEQKVGEDKVNCIERTYEGMKRYLLEVNPPIEGLVLEHRNTFYKIRSDAFDKRCRFKTSPEVVQPPVYLS